MTFGGTLALAGAIEEQRQTRPAHCEDGCLGCELEAHFIFEQWVRDRQSEDKWRNVEARAWTHSVRDRKRIPIRKEAHR